MKPKALRLKTISFLLSIVLIMACLPTSAIALDMNSSNVSTEIAEPEIVDPIIIDPILEESVIESATLEQLKSRAPDEKTISELKEMEVDVSSLPSFIDSSNALQKGHVNRLRSSEKNLSTVVFQNKDGTETTYIFMQPVKYIDDNGNVKDKSAKISSVIDTTYSYGMLDNNTKIYFPKNSNLGTKIQHQNYVIQMLPVTTYSSSPTYVDDTTVAYHGVYGGNTILMYQTKLNGVKEDIVLVKNIEKNEFDFTLTLSNLIPTQIDGIWYLKNSNNDIVGSLGKIIVNDSAGNSVEGTMTISPSTSRSTYSVKITVPNDFLNSNSTVYPVYVDPSTTIYESDYYYDDDGYSYEYDAIIDVGLYNSSTGVTNAQSNTNYHRLGYYSSSLGKVIYKLYDFYGEYGQYKNLTSAQIGNAYLHITVGSGTSTTVTASPMTSTWSDSSYGENPIAMNNSTLWNAYSSTNSSSLYLDTTSGEREINITEIVRGWADYNSGDSTATYNNPANGFMLSCDLTSSSRTVVAAEEFYADSVYVVMDTTHRGGSYYFTNSYSGGFLKRSSTTAVNTAKYTNSNTIRWFLEYIGNDKYYIRSMYNTNYALYGSGSSVSLSYMPTDPTDNYVWTITGATGGGVILSCVGSNNRVLKHDGSTLSLVTALSSTNAAYKQTVWGTISQVDYVNLSSFTVDNVDWISVGSQKYCSINDTPTNSTYGSANWFDWESDNSSVATVDENGRITGISSGYALITATHKPTGKSFSFYVTVGQTISNGTYYIMNKATGRFLDVEGPSTAENANIQEWELHDGAQGKWQITYYGSGYYYIKSIYSNKYVSVYNGSSAAGAIIIQSSTLSSANRWKITKLPDGALKITAECGEDNERCLGISSIAGYNGVNCSQITYSDDADYRDEWYISSAEKRIRINIQMDNGYISRYTNSSTAASRIEENLFKVREKYAEYFGICVDYSAATTIASHADACTGSTHSTACPHCSDTDCKSSTVNDSTKLYTLHHKNIYNIMARFEMPDLDTETLLVFIGHETCATNDAGHRGGYLGLTYSGYGIISLTNFGNAASESKTTMHEIGHLYYAKDHYDIGSVPSTAEIIISEGDARYNSDCIYGENKDDPDIAGNYVICGGCRARIESYSNRFNH